MWIYPTKVHLVFWDGVFSEQAGKLTAKDIRNVESFYELVRTDKVYKLFKDWLKQKI